MKKYYDILGIEIGVSQDAIKRAYREKAKEFHPDKHNNLSEGMKKLAEQEFKKITDAYEKIINSLNEKKASGNREKFKDNWRNLLVFGDNLQFLKTIYKNEDPLIKDKIKNKVKLIYIDPPFATASDFSTGEGQKAYSDKRHNQ